MPSHNKLHEDGFAVIPGPVPAHDLPSLCAAYDRAMSEADAADVGHGSTTTRVHDFVNRGAEFDPVYVFPPLLEACHQPCMSISRAGVWTRGLADCVQRLGVARSRPKPHRAATTLGARRAGPA
ncbi:MAG: hypothetical protein HY820_14415 [Acidobacteria bacterium]|nr:hypothetical protein [Acidobacteriota bacterium]